MKKNYLIFNINNCIEDYSSVFMFCENLYNTSGGAKPPEHIADKVFVYQGEESDSVEKVFAASFREIEHGTLRRYEAVKENMDKKHVDALL